MWNECVVLYYCNFVNNNSRQLNIIPHSSTIHNPHNRLGQLQNSIVGKQHMQLLSRYYVKHCTFFSFWIFVRGQILSSYTSMNVYSLCSYAVHKKNNETLIKPLTHCLC